MGRDRAPGPDRGSDKVHETPRLLAIRLFKLAVGVPLATEALLVEKIPAGLPVLEIPDPRSRTGPPGRSTSAARRTSERYVLCPCCWPRLSVATASSWPADALEEVLDTDPKPLLEGHGQGWMYVRRFVETTTPASKGPKATQALANLLRRTFATVRARPLRERADDVRFVVRALPADRRVRLPLPANWSEADRQAVLAEPAGVVLVPAEFDPDDVPAVGRLSTDEAEPSSCPSAALPAFENERAVARAVLAACKKTGPLQSFPVVRTLPCGKRAASPLTVCKKFSVTRG